MDIVRENIRNSKQTARDLMAFRFSKVFNGETDTRRMSIYEGGPRPSWLGQGGKV